MSPVALAGAFAGAFALVLLCLGGVVFARRSARDRQLMRRLRRVAAPLAGPTEATQAPGAESVFRPREKDARFPWLWRPLERLRLSESDYRADIETRVVDRCRQWTVAYRLRVARRTHDIPLSATAMVRELRGSGTPRAPDSEADGHRARARPRDADEPLRDCRRRVFPRRCRRGMMDTPERTPWRKRHRRPLDAPALNECAMCRADAALAARDSGAPTWLAAGARATPAQAR